jgi:hypothetical protein
LEAPIIPYVFARSSWDAAEGATGYTIVGQCDDSPDQVITADVSASQTTYDATMFSPWNWITVSFADLRPVVVPGISSLNAANAILGQGVVGVNSLTISSGDDLGTPGADGRLSGTVAFFTHRVKLEALVPRLRARYPADTPVVIVCDASYPTERMVRSDLGRVLDALREQKLPHLYLVYVGDALKQAPIRSGPSNPAAEAR